MSDLEERMGRMNVRGGRVHRGARGGGGGRVMGGWNRGGGRGGGGWARGGANTSLNLAEEDLRLKLNAQPQDLRFGRVWANLNCIHWCFWTGFSFLYYNT